MEDINAFKGIFFEESSELLSQAEQRLMDLSPENPSAETLGAIFRAVHSIKGGAGAFGFERLVKFTHSFESVLDALRSGKITLDAPRHRLLMMGFDLVSDLVRNAKGDIELAPDREASVLEGLNAWYPRSGAVLAKMTSLVATKAPPDPVSSKKIWIVFFRPDRSLYTKANEPSLLLRQLKSMGACTFICSTDPISPLDSFDPENAYLNWTIEIETEATKKQLAEVFEFVDGDCELIISPKEDFPARVPLNLEVNEVTHRPAAENKAVPAMMADAKEGALPTVTSIRVELDKIDRLVNMVGEIVITQAMVLQQLDRMDIESSELLNGLEAMQQHTRELQDSVMSIRAQPVKSVFQRMPRLVRELAGLLNKEIKLITVGENTEVDKTVIEQLSDPLTHMIRNSIDHGIESAEGRAAAGKPKEGTIMLSAAHRSGRIIIEITDDGGGINRERVKAKCIEKGLINADAQLTDEEIDNFIFLPGFSTAETISDVSGRGVGMDVVKKNIQDLGGRVHVQSRSGLGSRFILSLPLTLAVLDGMVVSVGAERYVLPLNSIIELLRPSEDMVSKLATHGDLLHFRGEYIRLLYLHSIFNVKEAAPPITDALVVLVEVEGGNKLGIVVDEVIGQQQVVIKSLESNYRKIEGISAATILGDGRVALILDVIGLQQILLAANVDKQNQTAHSVEAIS